MPTVRTVTVKPSGGDYTSLAAAEAGEQADLVAIDRQLNIECYAMSDTTPVVFDNWATDATRYISVYTPLTERHDGKWNTSKYLLEVTEATAFSSFENFLRIEGLQIKVTASTAATFIGVRQSSDATSDVRVTSCLIQGVLSGTCVGYGIAIYSATATVKLANNIIWDWIRGSSSIGIYVDNAAAVAAYNQTIHNSDIGVYAGVATVITAKNCLVNDCGDGYNGTFNAASTNNCSDISSDAPGSSPAGTTDVTFVDEAGDDFHLAVSDTVAKEAGTDLSADGTFAFSVDVDGQARSGTWDIGADEYVSTDVTWLPQSRTLYGPSVRLIDSGPRPPLTPTA